ncbi:MAG: ABC transporter substrate-binding protein [Bacillota bacterium]
MSADSSKMALILTMTLVMAVAAWGCSPAGEEGEPEPGGEARAGGEIIVGNNADVDTLDPGQYTDLYSGRVISQIFETLLTMDFDGEFGPGLAEDWDIQEGGAVWVFNLREGVKFHDGTEMTAEDVKFTLDRLKDEDYGSPRRADFAVIEEMTVVDDYTLEVVLQEPNMVFMTDLLSGHVVPKHYVEEVGDAEFASAPIGTGPFAFVEYRVDDYTELEAFDDYWGGRPSLDGLTFRPIPEVSTRIVELETGGIHVMGEVPGEELDRLAEEPGIEVATVTGTNWRVLAMNTEREPFDDPNVRKAIAHAIDKQRIIDTVYPGTSIPAQGPIPPTSWAYDPDFEGRNFDLDRAREYLAESNHPDGFEATLMVSEGEEIHREAPLIQRMLTELDIEIDIQSLEWGTFLERLTTQDYDMLRVGWTTNVEPDSLLYNTFHSSSEQFNMFGYNNARVDELLDRGRVEADIDKRTDIYREVQEILVEDVPGVFIYHDERVLAYRDNVQDLKPYFSGDFMFKTPFVDVWLSE